MMTQEIQPTISQTQKIRRPFFYRDKRVLLSFLVSIPTGYWFGLFAGILTHLAVGCFWDIWFFSYRRVKESDIAPQEWFDYTGMTREQLDHHSQVFMWLRHGAFVVCSLTTIADVFIEFGIAYIFTFGLTYFIFRVITAQYLSYNKMIYPWIGAKTQVEGRNSPDNFDQTYFIKRNDLTDSSNPIGFFNPSSSRYVLRSD